MNEIEKQNRLRHSVLRVSIVCTCCVWPFVACTDTEGEAVPDVSLSAVPISLTASRADAATTTTTTTTKVEVPCFVAWLENDITDVSNRKSVTGIASDLFAVEPFFCLNATGDVDDYKQTPFNTGCYYPTADQNVYVSGYYPADSLQKVSDYYAGECMELKSTTRPGLTDILVATNTLKGSASAPLDAADAGSLTFNHALAKVTFKGILDPSMTKYISNVTLTLPAAGQLMRGLYASYDNCEGQIFQPYAWQEEEGVTLPEWTSRTLTGYLISEEAKELGTVYVVPGYSITVDVSYRFSEKNITYEDITNKGLVVYFTDSNNESISLKSGDSYEVTLSFLENTIELTAQPVAWQEGGEIYIPLYPYKNITNE